MALQPSESTSAELIKGLVRAMKRHSEAMDRIPFDENVSASWIGVLDALQPVLNRLGATEEDLAEARFARLHDTLRRDS